MVTAEGFEALIEQYHPIIYKICRVYSGADDFEDLYQEVLINLWKSFSSFEGRSKLSTWLYRVTLNTALTYRRNEKKHRTNVLHGPIPEVQDPVGNAREKERDIERLYAAIRQLKKEDQSVILLYLEEKSYDEIAEITGLTQSNVGVKISRSKKRLFELLNESNHG